MYAPLPPKPSHPPSSNNAENEKPKDSANFHLRYEDDYPRPHAAYFDEAKFLREYENDSPRAMRKAEADEARFDPSRPAYEHDYPRRPPPPANSQKKVEVKEEDDKLDPEQEKSNERRVNLSNEGPRPILPPSAGGNAKPAGDWTLFLSAQFK